MTGKRSYRQLVDAAGATKSVVRGDEVLIDAATLGPHKGKEMTIVSGRHAGLQCVVQLVSDDSGVPALLHVLGIATGRALCCRYGEARCECGARRLRRR